MSVYGRYEQEGESFGRVSSEGGDIMPIGNRTVAIGMSERTTGQMIEKIARSLFEAGAADRVIAAGMSRDRAHMHLDTVFTFLDRDAVTVFPKVVASITAYSVRPGDGKGTFDVRREPSFLGAVKDALGLRTLRVIETGGDRWESEREQWDDGNNVVALEPGVVLADAPRRDRGPDDRRIGARARARRRPLHDVPDRPGSRVTAPASQQREP